MYIIIAGAGKVGYYLGKELLADGHEVLVIERDYKRAQQAAGQLTIARVNNPQNEELFHRLGIDVTVSSTKLILSLIEQELPSRPFIPLVHLRSIGMEIVELNALTNSPLIGRRVGDLHLPPNSTISLIMRGSETVIPTPDTVVEPDDKLIGFAPMAQEGELVQAVQQT